MSKIFFFIICKTIDQVFSMMKKITILCLCIGLPICGMDNHYNKKKLDEKMSPALYGLKYGFNALLEREKIKPVEFNTITIVKRNGKTEIGTDNFFIFSSNDKITFCPKENYSYVNNLKCPIKYTHNEKKFPDLYNKINTIVSSAHKEIKIGELQYYKVNSDLIRDMEECITK